MAFASTMPARARARGGLSPGGSAAARLPGLPIPTLLLIAPAVH